MKDRRRTAGVWQRTAAVGLVFAGVAAQAVETEIDVSAGGALATPVKLHVDTEYAAWLEADNWYNFSQYHANGVTEKSPQPVVKLVWGDAGRSLVYSNLCVGATYEWRVTKDDGTELAGSFTTEAAAPRVLTIPVANGKVLRNVRDLGGWPLMGVTKDGRTTTKQGVYYRGGNLDDFYDGEQIGISWWNSHADEAEALRAANRAYTELGIKTELDLRMAQVDGSDNKVKILEHLTNPEDEVFYYPSPKDGYPYHPEAVEQDGKLTFTHAPACRNIKLFITPMVGASLSYKEEMRRVFHVLGTADNLPAYFHCRIGRDRTGIVALILSALVGVDEPSLYRDYLTSNFGWVGDAGATGSDLDTFLKDLYRGTTAGSAAQVHGLSLAGRTRAYLESIGVTQAEIATITEALTGETPDEVLARVDAYETANNYQTLKFLSKQGTTTSTPGLHRAAAAAMATFPPPATAPTTAAGSGLVYGGWGAATLQEDGSYAAEAVWTPRWRVCFVDAFGGLLGSCDVADGGSAAGQEPAAPQGTRITGWDVDYTHVVSNLTVRAVMEGVDGYAGTTGELVTDEAILARGGDSVRCIERAMTVDYVHVFSDPAAAKAFVNNTGDELLVSYLVVGGGGAGGDQYKGSDGISSGAVIMGAAGGGGGGVIGRTATLAPGEAWSIQVGAGGQTAMDRYLPRIPAGASSISNETSEVALAPGGGGGGSGSSNSSVRPGQAGQAGAAGGGATTFAVAACKYAAGTGTFASECDGVSYGIHDGGKTDKLAYTDQTIYLSGGGGGAATTGVDFMRSRAGSGGRGIYSSISGVLACYGAGGGAGGGYMPLRATQFAANNLPNGIGEGFGGSNGGWGGYYQDGAWFGAQAGSDGFGGGGGGATWNGGTQTAGSAHETVVGGNGGSGVVIVRYSLLKAGAAAYTPRTEGNEGEVTFTGSVPSLALDPLGNVRIKPGTTATLSATDAGGCVVSAWRDESTGELFWGETVTVTPTRMTEYTACFGRRWIWNSKTSPATFYEETESDDKWVFTMASRSGNQLVFSGVQQVRSDGYLNLATPVISVGGGGVTAYYPYKLANAMFRDKAYPTTLILPSQEIRIEGNCFYGNTGLSGILCFPKTTILRSNIFRDCTTLQGVFFKDAANGSLELSASGYQFYNTTGMRGALDLPATVTVEGKTGEPLPDHFTRRAGVSSASFPGVVKFGTTCASGCANLTNITLSAATTSIGTQAFAENTKLVSVTPFFPSTLREIGEEAFINDTALAGDPCLDGVVEVGAKAFEGCLFTSVSLANDTEAVTLRARAFYSAPLTNVVCGVGGLVLPTDGDNRQFYMCADGCRFWFPGPAPELPPATLTDGTTVRATGRQRLFGSKTNPTKYPRLYGNWKADKAGWEKILAEIGGPVSEAGVEPPAVEKGERVRGTFNWLYSVDDAASAATLLPGWLIDYGPQPAGAVMILVR